MGSGYLGMRALPNELANIPEDNDEGIVAVLPVDMRLVRLLINCKFRRRGMKQRA